MDSVIEQCGIQLSPVLRLRTDNCFQFVRSLEHKLAQDSRCIEEFVCGFKDMCNEDEERLVMFLSPLESDTDSSSSDSLVQMIMSSRLLQNGVMSALVDMLEDKYCSWSRSHSRVMRFSQSNSQTIYSHHRATSTQSVTFQSAMNNKTYSIPQLIINHFMWVTQVFECEPWQQPISVKIAQKCHYFSPDLKRAMLQCITVLAVDRSFHDVIADSLLDGTSANDELYTEVVEVVGGLGGISVETQMRLRSDVSEKLTDCSGLQIPQLVKFLLESASSTGNTHDTCDAIQRVRSSVDISKLTTQHEPRKSIRPSSQHILMSQQRSVSPIHSNLISVMHMQMVHSRGVSKAWMDILEDKTSRLVELDLVAAVIMNELEVMPKGLDVIVKQLLKTSQLKGSLFKDTLTSFKELTKLYRQTLLDLLAALLDQSDASMKQFTIEYAVSFFISSETYTRQEIIVQLVTNMCSNQESTKTIFSILDAIMQTHGSSLRQFSTSFSGIFDRMAKLELGQIRKLFRILTALQFKKSKEDSVINKELFTVVQNHLNEESERSGKIGVIASFGIMSQIAETIATYNDKDYSDKMSREVLKIIDVLEEVLESRSGLLNLFFEEFYLFMESIDCEIISSRISGRLKQTMNDFGEIFLSEKEDENDYAENLSCSGVECAYRFNLNESFTLVVDLPKIMDNLSDKNALCLALPAFVKCFCALNMPGERTTGNCSKSLSNSAKKMLELPFLFPEEKYDNLIDELNLSDIQLQFIGDCNLALANILRETINVVTKDENSNIIQDKSCLLNLSLRLKLLDKVQKRFLELLKIFPGYGVPGICNAYNLIETSDNEKSSSLFSLPHQASLQGPHKLPKVKTSAARSRKRKRPVNSGQDEEGFDNNDVDNEENDVISNTSSRSQGAIDTQGHGTTVLTAPLSTAYSELGLPTPKSNTSDINMGTYFAFFTELPMHVFNLLKPEANQLNVDDYFNCDSLMPPEVIRLMLSELHLKLKFALIGRTEINSAVNKERLVGVNVNGYYKLANMSQGPIGKCCVELFPVLVEISQAIVDHVASLYHNNDPLNGDTDTLAEEKKLLSECLSLLLRSIYSIFNWKVFKCSPICDGETETTSLSLEDILEPIAERYLNLPSIVKPGLIDLLEASKQFFINMCDSVDNITLAVELCALCNLIAKITDETLQANSVGRSSMVSIDQFEPVSSLAHLFLKREWTENVSSSQEIESESQSDSSSQISQAQFNSALSQLANYYFYGSASPFRCIEKSIKSSAKSVLIDMNESVLPATSVVVPFPAVTTDTFHAFYKSAWNMLVYFAKKVPLISKKDCLRKDHQSVTRRNNCMQEWFKCIKCLYTCLKVAKAMNSRLIFTTIVRGAIALIEQFVKKAVPLLEVTFKNFTVDVRAMMRNIRECSQDLQVVCTHSKVTNDVSLMRNVPKLRKNLESLLFNVKSVFAYHGCLDQFSMVPLRNRAINGEEIFSQRELPDEESFNNGNDENGDNESDDNDNDDFEISRHNALSSQVLRERNVNTSGASSDAESVGSRFSNYGDRNRNRGPVLSEAESDGGESSARSSLDGDEPVRVSRISKRKSRGAVDEDSDVDSIDCDSDLDSNYDGRSVEL